MDREQPPVTSPPIGRIERRPNRPMLWEVPGSKPLGVSCRGRAILHGPRPTRVRSGHRRYCLNIRPDTTVQVRKDRHIPKVRFKTRVCTRRRTGDIGDTCWWRRKKLYKILPYRTVPYGTLGFLGLVNRAVPYRTVRWKILRRKPQD
jgi:hypothetical protein